MISAKFVPLKYYTLSSQLQRLTSFSVGCSGRRILSPGQIAVMRKWSIHATVGFSCLNVHKMAFSQFIMLTLFNDVRVYVKVLPGPEKCRSDVM